MLPDLFASQNPAYATIPLPVWLDLAAVIVGSFSGLLYAREKHLDLLGYVGLAIICGLGGGLIRDTIMQVGDVYLLRSKWAIIAAIGTGILGFFFPASITALPHLLEVVDILSVGLFAAVGADKAIVYQLFPIPIIFMGTITGVGGGMMRDVFLGEVPRIFRPSNWYAYCAIGGAVAYYLCASVLLFDKVWAMVVCVMVTLLLRQSSLRFGLQSTADGDLMPKVRDAAQAVADAAREATSNEMEHALEQYERHQTIQTRGRAGKHTDE